MPIYEKIFYNILDDIRKKHPNLKINLFKTTQFADSAQGEYVHNYIRIAINNAWEHNIMTLLHEYSHFLRECKYSREQRRYINRVYDNYDKNGLTKKERYKLLCAVAKEEYLTDIMAAKFLKKYKVPELLKEHIKDANRYNLAIKYSLYMNGYTFLRNKVKISDKLMFGQLSGRPLTKGELKKLQQWDKEGRLGKPSKLWRDKDE